MIDCAEYLKQLLAINLEFFSQHSISNNPLLFLVPLNQDSVQFSELFLFAILALKSPKYMVSDIDDLSVSFQVFVGLLHFVWKFCSPFKGVWLSIDNTNTVLGFFMFDL